MNTGDRAHTGCIWTMLLQKAWVLYLLDHVDVPDEEPRYPPPPPPCRDSQYFAHKFTHISCVMGQTSLPGRFFHTTVVNIGNVVETNGVVCNNGLQDVPPWGCTPSLPHAVLLFPTTFSFVEVISVPGVFFHTHMVLRTVFKLIKLCVITGGRLKSTWRAPPSRRRALPWLAGTVLQQAPTSSSPRASMISITRSFAPPFTADLGTVTAILYTPLLCAVIICATLLCAIIHGAAIRGAAIVCRSHLRSNILCSNPVCGVSMISL